MKYKECFLNDNTCGPINKETGKPKIKEAHILSRAATMSKICGNVNGQKEVYKASTQKSEGWKKASAYHCFCENHDTELFLPIENDNPFDPNNKEQLFAHTLRSFSYEYHHKRIDLDSNFSLASGLNELLSSFSNILGDDSIINDLDSRYDDHLYAHESIKTELIKAYRERNFDSLVFKTFVIDEKFTLASAGTLMAEIVSPYKSSIVYFNQTEHLLRRPAIILTVFPDPVKEYTNIILGCLKSDKNATLYLDKYNSLEPKEVLLAVSSLMLTTNRNNTFFHPLYWNAIQKHPLKTHFESEIKKDRGFDLINQVIQLSKFNLFDKNLVWDKIKPDT